MEEPLDQLGFLALCLMESEMIPKIRLEVDDSVRNPGGGIESPQEPVCHFFRYLFSLFFRRGMFTFFEVGVIP